MQFKQDVTPITGRLPLPSMEFRAQGVVPRGAVPLVSCPWRHSSGVVPACSWCWFGALPVAPCPHGVVPLMPYTVMCPWSRATVAVPMCRARGAVPSWHCAPQVQWPCGRLAQCRNPGAVPVAPCPCLCQWRDALKCHRGAVLMVACLWYRAPGAVHAVQCRVQYVPMVLPRDAVLVAPCTEALGL